MLIFCRKDRPPSEREEVLRSVRAAGFFAEPLGADLIAAFGDGDSSVLAGLPGVERVTETPGSPVLAERGSREGTSTAAVGDLLVGAGFAVIAGPCAVEGRERMLDLAEAAKAAGADALRGGAYKPRTSPYSFRGMGIRGLEILAEARDATGLPVVTEVLDTRDVEVVADHADAIQVGTRNMMNYALLDEVGRAGRPVLLKRGFSSTVQEFLYAAEYLLLQGAPGVILCERGVRAFGDHLRFTLDLSVVPVLKERTHLPVVVDPSHATGVRRMVPAMARAAAAAGADGVMLEIHPEPDSALSDGEQAIDPAGLPDLVADLREIAAIASRAAGR